MQMSGQTNSLETCTLKIKNFVVKISQNKIFWSERKKNLQKIVLEIKYDRCTAHMKKKKYVFIKEMKIFPLAIIYPFPEC